MSFGRLTLSFSSISIRRFNALLETRSSRSPQPHCPDGLPDARPDAGNHRRRTLHALRARPGPDKVRSRTQRPRHPPSGRLLGAASDGLFFAGRSRTHLPHCLRRQRRFCVSAARHARHHEEGPGLHFELTVPGGEIFAQLRSGEIDFTIFPFESVPEHSIHRDAQASPLHLPTPSAGFRLLPLRRSTRRETQLPLPRASVALVQQPNPTALQAGSALMRLLELPSAAGLRLEDKLFCKRSKEALRILPFTIRHGLFNKYPRNSPSNA